MKKLIVILGPTASGKSSLAVKLAQKFNGEIISADSRQVYKRLRIGANTVTKKEKRGVKHHLIEFLDPRKNFSASQFQKLALKKIQEIHKRNKLPFLVGGTGFYIDAVAENKTLPKAKADKKLRQSLGQKTAKQLFNILKKLNPERAVNIDRHNPRRLIRAIEIICSPNSQFVIRNSQQVELGVLYIGIKKSPKQLKQNITDRFVQWLEAGFLMEVEKLIKLGVSRKKFKEFGLHYWHAYLFLKKEIDFKSFWNSSLKSLWHYAKRQNTWFKKNKKIHWIHPHTSRGVGVKAQKQAAALIKKFLKT